MRDERGVADRLPDPKTVGVAISGGGHRATAFALGALLYLVDCGLNAKVGTITSVSGGSILNAFVALLGSGATPRPFKAFSPLGFDPDAARLASMLAGRPAMWATTVTLALWGLAVAVLLFLDGALEAGEMFVSLGVFLVILSLVVGPRSGGSLWGWWGTWLYCSALIWLALWCVVSTNTSRWWPADLGLAILILGWLLQQRHFVAERAYEATVCRLSAERRWWSLNRVRLEEMSRAVRHVFCATEMHSGQHAYFSHDFVYARGFGLGTPCHLPVAAAVQVSANFPGGFPLRPMKASRFAFTLTDRFEDATELAIRSGRDILMPDRDMEWATAHQEFPKPRPLPNWLMLSDGGVFDNLAADWFLENGARVSRFEMSLNWNWDPARNDWIESETNTRDKAILAPLRDACDLLIVVNAGVTGHWQRSSSAMVSLPYLGEVLGLSQISGTMYNNYTKERVLRSMAEHLVVEMAYSERLVRTTLLPLGVKGTARLIKAGYDHAMFVAHRRLGHPLLKSNAEDFESLAQGHPSERMIELLTIGGLSDFSGLKPRPLPGHELH